jgi:hypothetical protein
MLGHHNLQDSLDKQRILENLIFETWLPIL